MTENERILLDALPDTATLYEVGGGVRDAILILYTPKDHDYLVTGISGTQLTFYAQLADLRVDYVGASFGVYKIKMPDGETLDVALPRTETSFGPGHTDFDVDAGAHVTLEDDLRRRDYSCNAIARNVKTGEIVDPYFGQIDLELGTLNFVGAAEDRVTEDPLRLLRGYRLMAKYGLRPSRRTQKAFNTTRSRQLLRTVSKERISGELMRILSEARDASALATTLYAMLHWGALEVIFPFFFEAARFDQQNPHHDRNLADHLIDTACEVKRLGGQPLTILAALLHDCGKMSAQTIGDDGIAHYLGHEQLGELLAQSLLEGLKFSTADTEAVSTLILHHMRLSPKDGVSDKALRRFMNALGPLWEESLIHRTADILTHSPHPGEPGGEAWLHETVARCRALANAGAMVKTDTLALSGDDIMQLCGLTPGKAVGDVKRHLTALVVDGEVANERWALLTALSGMFFPRA